MKRDEFNRVHNARKAVWEAYIAHPERFAPQVSRHARPAVRTPLWRKVKQFLKAYTGKRVSKKIANERLSICEGCPQHEVRKKARYCNACGCPKWLPADLRIKAKLAEAPCPLKRWPLIRGVENGDSKAGTQSSQNEG